MSKISRLVKELGYMGLFAVKGGRALLKLSSEYKPKAVVGIACYYEGELAFKVFKGSDVAVQYVPLNKDGCANTDTNIEEVEKVLKQTENG